MIKGLLSLATTHHSHHSAIFLEGPVTNLFVIKILFLVTGFVIKIVIFVFLFPQIKCLGRT